MKMIVCLNRVRSLADEERRTNIIEKKTEAVSLNNEERYLLETALNLVRTGEGGSVIVVAAGLQIDTLMLREALAMGCSKAYLDVYDGGDELASGEVAARMAETIQNEVKVHEEVFVITGERTMDGLYGFLGPQLAALLQVPFIASLEMPRAHRGVILGQRIKGDRSYQITVRSASLITLVNARAKGKPLSVMDIRASFEKELHVIKAVNGERAASDSLLIHCIYPDEKTKICEMYDEISLEEAADIVVEKLRERRLL